MSNRLSSACAALFLCLASSSGASADHHEKAPATEAVPTATVESKAPVAPVAPVAVVKKKPKKGFNLTSADGKSALNISGRVQARFTYDKPDGADAGNEFNLVRARIKAKGHAYTKALTYLFQLDMGKGAVPTLKDFVVDYRPGAAKIWLRAGQFKLPTSRVFLNSSSKMQLVERGIMHSALGGPRDIGVAVHNNYEKSPELEWVVGVFNGTAADKSRFDGSADPMTGEVSGKWTSATDEVKPTIAVRVGWNGNGIKGYEQVDWKGGPLRLAVGASLIAEFDADNDDSSGLSGELDFIAKASFFSLIGGVFASTTQDDTKFTDQSYEQLGFHAQLGYLLQGKFLPAVRFGMVAPDGADNNVMEITGGLTFFRFKHAFKIQADAGALIRQGAGGSSTDLLIRTQMQFSY